MIPARYGPCINASCDGLISADDGTFHNVSVILIDNSGNSQCVVFDGGHLVTSSCTALFKLICQYDPHDPAGYTIYI